jgi:prevent-host-death family protein
MVTANIDEAQSQFARLIDLAEKGEEVVIARAGRPVVRLLPCPGAGQPREGGQWRGQVHIAPDFDELPSELRDALGMQAK